ncbi:hypothetical protein GMORB2_5278 [Geosmithia morbida]|uniref:Uncharacterized protein n=1 Tax=Geosmithia morbida TaxID=1094350 RepID=A0A9P4YZG3_9HYPO|nr:uncharacterized protein GMORB2_5278 [Geosmithia morbida]KAF4124612.1 hypothetical protein GMORB2_5278 [Geosmithia morbida]
MAEVQYNFQSAVWHYTYRHGPEAGVVFLESPQRFWSNQRGSIVLRQVNSTSANKAWVNRDPSLVKRCRSDLDQSSGDGRVDFPTLSDAHGLLIKNGWATPATECKSGASPTRHNNNDDGHGGGGGGGGADRPLVPYRRGERIWVEHSLQPSDAEGDDGSIPVISIDTLRHFRVPSRYICFVPQLVRPSFETLPLPRGISPSVFATPVGPAHDMSVRGCRYKMQAYFEWPSNQPARATCKWETWPSLPSSSSATAEGVVVPRLPTRFHPLADVEERRRLFRHHWAILSGQFSVALDDDAESIDEIDLVERGIRHVDIAVAL